MNLKTINWTIASLVILTNLYFLPMTFYILQNRGGPMGYGLVVLPMTFSVNLLLISAGLVFKKQYERNRGFLGFNAVGLVWALFWLWFFVTALDYNLPTQSCILPIHPIPSIKVRPPFLPEKFTSGRIFLFEHERFREVGSFVADAGHKVGKMRTEVVSQNPVT